MRMIAKLASLGTPHQRSPLNEIIHHVKRAWGVGSDRKVTRRLQDIDSWSDQAEIAYYEDCRAARCS